MAVQRRVGAADLVQPADLGRDIAGPVPVPDADLVFLGIDVLLAPSQGAGLAKLEAVVHPPEPRERAGERGADQERRPPAGLEKEGIDVRRVDEEMRTEEIRHRLFGKLGEVRSQLIFGVAPGEIRVRLRESDLRQPVHHRRPGEGLGEKDHVRVARADVIDQPLPERQRLGVRIVDAEDAHPLRRSRTARRRAAPPRAPAPRPAHRTRR